MYTKTRLPSDFIIAPIYSISYEKEPLCPYIMMAIRPNDGGLSYLNRRTCLLFESSSKRN